MEIIIREFKFADHKALAEITREAFVGVCLEYFVEKYMGERAGQSWQEHKLRTMRYELKSPFIDSLVAEADGEPAGYLTYEVQHEQSTGWVRNLAVAGKWQGKGIGKALLRAVLDRFRAEGLKFARIETMANNERARAFYRREGFEEVVERVYLYKTL